MLDLVVIARLLLLQTVTYILYTHTVYHRDSDIFEDYDALRGGPGVFHS
jgi:hypothetical protein